MFPKFELDRKSKIFKSTITSSIDLRLISDSSCHQRFTIVDSAYIHHQRITFFAHYIPGSETRHLRHSVSFENSSGPFQISFRNSFESRLERQLTACTVSRDTQGFENNFNRPKNDILEKSEGVVQLTKLHLERCQINYIGMNTVSMLISILDRFLGAWIAQPCWQGTARPCFPPMVSVTVGSQSTW